MFLLLSSKGKGYNHTVFKKKYVKLIFAAIFMNLNCPIFTTKIIHLLAKKTKQPKQLHT